MFHSGICDEAGKTLAKQLSAHKELGWEYVELRAKLGTASDKNLSTLTDAEFDGVCAELDEAGMKVSCYASKLGDWSRKITDDLQVDIDDLNNAMPRLQKLDIPFVRCMSYVNDGLPEDDWRDEAVRRMNELAKIAEDGGITLVHENCTGWGGLTWQNNLYLMDKVKSPALKVVFDTGNPPFHGQDSWEYYNQIKDHIAYVHIKDSLRYMPGGKAIFTYPGEGDGCVKSVIGDLVERGYEGGMSIEPHLAAIIHTAQEGDNEDLMYREYVEYGNRLMAIVKDAQDRTA